MGPAVFSTLHDLRDGRRGLPCHVLECEIHSPYLQLPAMLIFADHYLGWITALMAITTLGSLCWSLWITVPFSSPEPRILWLRMNRTSLLQPCAKEKSSGVEIDHCTCFRRLFASLAPSPYHPSKESGHGRYWVQWVSPLKFLQHNGASWWPLTEFPRKFPAMRCIFAGPPPTLDGNSSQAHQLVMSLTTTGWAAWWDTAVEQSATNR